MDSPIFIVGCPRSGTTLLRDLLRSHPRVTIPRESHFIPRFYRAYGDPRNEREAVLLAARILQVRGVKSLELDLRPDAFAGCRTFAQAVTLLYEEWARKENKVRWGDKTPQYVNDIPLLLELFPRAKIIHIYRDGRDVALSLIASHMAGNLFSAAKAWKSYVNAGRRAGRALPPETYLEVRYEMLLGDPAATMSQVCRFIGEPFCKAVLVPNSLSRHLHSHAPWMKDRKIGSDKRILDTNFDKWKTEFAPSDRILFESVAGDLLGELGYETEGHVRSVSHFETVLWRAHDGCRFVVSRLGTIRRPDFIRTFAMFQWARARAHFRRTHLRA